jgi:hypothetical protein
LSEEEAEKSKTTNCKKILISNFEFLKENCLRMLEEASSKHQENRFLYEVLLDFSIFEKDK